MTPSFDLTEIASRAADCLLTYPWKLWFWGDSIGLEGLLDASEVTANPKYSAFVHGLLKGWISREHLRSEFDYTAPGVALLRVYEQTGDTALLQAARRHAEYMAAFRQTSGGAYVRYENAAIELPPVLPPDHSDNETSKRDAANTSDGGPCVFVDSVHFDGPFFAKLYQVTGEQRYRELALGNILSQIALLYDEKEQLFNHFWIERSGRPNGVLWGRGNGWALLGASLTLEYLGAGDTDTASLRDVIRRTLARLAGLQDPSGGWHTVINDPSSYIETSTAAFFSDVICRAVRLGIVSFDSFEGVLEGATSYMFSRLRNDGVLDGVSYETFPSTRTEHYRTMPRGALAPWGQGPLLAAIQSYMHLMANVPKPAPLPVQEGSEKPHAAR